MKPYAKTKTSETLSNKTDRAAGSPKTPQAEPTAPRDASKGNPLILQTSIRWLVYIILFLAFFLFWYGHHAPGGGFIAGLITAAAVLLAYLALGSRWLHSLDFDFKYLVAIGLSLALVCGLAAVLLGRPFLTHSFGVLSLPLLGDIQWTTATVFDLGVYCTVCGACLSIITAIGESGRDGRPDRKVHIPGRQNPRHKDEA
ncbi:MAG: Na(+)/H(+) antiporter subunit B [Firmicutes bacterium]|nr:Na(+)/H(+) antiporter subunit B [Bacillota bacterium]